MGKQSGTRNPNWKGGRTIASSGYVLIRVGSSHHLADVRGYAYEHRLVAEKKAGRRLRSGEQVHHVNGDKRDNRPENLEITESIVFHRVEHRKRKDLKHPKQPNETVLCACGCGTAFQKYDATNRPRRFVTGHNIIRRNAING